MRLPGQPDRVLAAAFFPDGRQVITAGRGQAGRNAPRIDVATATGLAVIACEYLDAAAYAGVEDAERQRALCAPLRGLDP